MYARPIIGCSDIWAPDIKQMISDAVPDSFELRFASNNDSAEWGGLLSASHYLILGVERVDDEFFTQTPNLKMIHRWGIGTDSIDKDSAQRAGVRVAITAGANANAVAEHTMMLILASLRHLSVIDRALRNDVWMYREMRSRAFQLRGRTVGLIGFSNIGRAVARMLGAFGTTVLYYDPVRAPLDVEASTAARYVDLDTLLSSSDIVSLHCPGGGRNTHLINEATISCMKNGAIVINTARGDLIDESALAAALASGKLSHAGLDVFEVEPPLPDNPLLASDRTCLTPHTAGSVLDNVTNVASHIFRNIDLHERGGHIPPQDIVV